MSFHNPLSLTPQPAVPLAQRSIAAASIGSTYTIVGTIFSSAVIQIFLISTLDQPVQVSLNGTTDFIPVLANSAIAIDIRTNSAALSGNYGVYVKEIGNPTSGNLYVSAISV